jgi:hypothetical protein
MEMTEFEQFAKDLGVVITIGSDGRYTGLAEALAIMTNDVILSDDDKIFNLSWDQQKDIIKDRFFKTFAYMAQ